MTGYASTQLGAVSEPPAADGRPAMAVQPGIEIRSVNSRFLDLSFRLPEDMRQLEPALRELLVTRLKRGKVEVRAWLDNGSASGLPEPSARMLQKLNGLQDSVRAWFPEARPLSVAEVVRLAVADQPGSREWSRQVIPLAEKALKELLAARQREGARLSTMLLAHIGQLRELAAQAEPLIPRLVDQQRQRFMERWKEAMALGEGAALPEMAQDRALAEATDRKSVV